MSSRAQQQRMRRKSTYLTGHDAEKAEMKAAKESKRLSLQSTGSNDNGDRRSSVASSSRRSSVASGGRRSSAVSGGRRSSVASLMSMLSIGSSDGESRRGSIFGGSDSRRSSFMSFGRRDSGAYSTYSVEEEPEEEKKPSLEVHQEETEPVRKPTYRDYQRQSIADSFSNTAAPGPGNQARRGSQNFSSQGRRMSYYPPPVVPQTTASGRRMSYQPAPPPSYGRRPSAAFHQTPYREIPASSRRKSTYV